LGREIQENDPHFLGARKVQKAPHSDTSIERTQGEGNLKRKTIIQWGAKG